MLGLSETTEHYAPDVLMISHAPRLDSRNRPQATQGFDTIDLAPDDHHARHCEKKLPVEIDRDARVKRPEFCIPHWVLVALHWTIFSSKSNENTARYLAYHGQVVNPRRTHFVCVTRTTSVIV